MALLSLRNVSQSFGGPALLGRICLQLERGERVALVGRNGEGKTTLLKIIAGEIEPDEGIVELAPGCRVAHLEQQVPVASTRGTVYDLVSTVLTAPAAGTGKGAPAPERHEVDKAISRLSLDPAAALADLSAGLKRRVLLARALVGEPELLLLDEPTNHLDIDAIVWLEELLLRREQALLFVTHDRVFLQRLATRIIELDRGALHDWRCDYQSYCRRRDKVLEDEAAHAAAFDKQLAEEEAWLRQGIKARRTRNEGRVRALQQLRAERQARRERAGAAKLTVQEAERSGKLVIRAKGVTVGFGGEPLIKGFSTIIIRGDRVGIIGPNNCGKTTLLRTLLGQLAPREGTVRHGARLSIAYFDQLRAQLKDDEPVLDSVAEGADHITINGRRRHVLGYLSDFLFSPERARSPVSSLSGGERNRLLLARLFAKPSNVLVLDEPTNDLDAETLELLEERLIEYDGTVLLVSHDRALLNNVVTATLSFDAPGVIGEYAGGYDDWLSQRPAPPEAAPVADKRPGHKPRTAGAPKLTFKEQRELERLPARIEALEQEQAELQQTMADPSFYRQEGAAIATAKERLDALAAELEQAYERWQALEDVSAPAGDG